MPALAPVTMAVLFSGSNFTRLAFGDLREHQTLNPHPTCAYSRGEDTQFFSSKRIEKRILFLGALSTLEKYFAFARSDLLVEFLVE